MEAEFVQWLGQRLRVRDDVLVGIGDDAAVYAAAVAPDGKSVPQVVTTDLLCEGVHFLTDAISHDLIGRKSLAVNLSDIAAMAARPRVAVISLLWPRDRAFDQARQLYEGLLTLADEFQVAVVGGDTNSWSGPLVVSVTLIGEVTQRGALKRSSAQVGDAILVTGQLGGSLLGHHVQFRPRVNEALYLRTNYELHAGMDITDGLSLDLHRLTQASQVGAELDLEAVPVSDAAVQMSRSSGQRPVDHALGDGEDFELLFTTTPQVAERLLREQPLAVSLTQIGTIVRAPGLWQRNAQGQRIALPVRGYLH